jgi:hypothetical protein
MHGSFAEMVEIVLDKSQVFGIISHTLVSLKAAGGRSFYLI